MKYFGTDGIRMQAAEFLRGDFTLKLARSLKGVNPALKSVVVGRDTRLSGEAIEEALCLGLVQSGVQVLSAGIVPTPTVAYLTKTLGADFGIVISASHNPPQDNGIKIFGSDGYKLPDENQSLLEQLIDEGFYLPYAGGGYGRANRAQYIDYATSFIDADFKGVKVKLDCGYGASSYIAKEIFSKLGAEVMTENEGYDGALINVASGSTHIDKLNVGDAYIAFAFDGDADRVLAKNQKGEVIDGDVFLLILSQYYKSKGLLGGNTVVGTILSNSALEQALLKQDINFLRADVGDIFVQQKMLEGGYSLGAEQSGHIIMDGTVRTGDGILAAAMLLKALLELGIDPNAISDIYQPYPQVSIDIAVNEHQKKVIERESIKQKLCIAQDCLKGKGFVVLRKSGTEPKIRIMVQAEQMQTAQRLASDLEISVRDELKNL